MGDTPSLGVTDGFGNFKLLVCTLLRLCLLAL